MGCVSPQHSQKNASAQGEERRAPIAEAVRARRVVVVRRRSRVEVLVGLELVVVVGEAVLEVGPPAPGADLVEVRVARVLVDARRDPVDGEGLGHGPAQVLGDAPAVAGRRGRAGSGRARTASRRRDATAGRCALPRSCRSWRSDSRPGSGRIPSTLNQLKWPETSRASDSLMRSSRPGTRPALQPFAGFVGLSPDSSGGGAEGEELASRVQAGQTRAELDVGSNRRRLAREHASGEEIRLLEAPLLLVLVGAGIVKEVKLTPTPKRQASWLRKRLKSPATGLSRRLPKSPPGAAEAEGRAQTPAGPALEAAHRRRRGLKPGATVRRSCPRQSRPCRSFRRQSLQWPLCRRRTSR